MCSGESICLSLLLNALFPWWWAEDVAALVFLLWLVQETRDILEEARGAGRTRGTNSVSHLDLVVEVYRKQPITTPSRNMKRHSWESRRAFPQHSNAALPNRHGSVISSPVILSFSSYNAS